jgi:type VI secretion system secreted protein VgrG
MYTQENRYITIDTPLGEDVLLLTRFSGTEGISRSFHFELELLSQNHEVQFKEIIGKNVSIAILLSDGSKRYFHGMVSRFSQGRGGGEKGGDPRFSHCTATAVPWFWLLTQTADSRIFQELTVPEIVEKIFAEKGFSDYKMLLDGQYEPRNFCVQYRETDYNFVSRLLEEEGIFYFFQHEKDRHTMVLADSNGKFQDCPKQKSARYQVTEGGWLEEDTVSGLQVTQEIKPSKYTLTDYNFEMPHTNLRVEVPAKLSLAAGEWEIYDYPGEYAKKNEGEQIANTRMQEQEAAITVLTGSSGCRAFSTGYRFTLEDHYRDDLNGKPYVITSLNYDAQQSFSGGEHVSKNAYVNQFTCIPYEVPYRPPRVTQRPIVKGNQTAIVVGPSGEEIYTDEHGRVKVQFHWDREGKKNENSSCWIRVSQLWAGMGWGAMYIPRIGQEVIVDFLEGDPDRPIITGRVYHGTNKPPYNLPGEKTKSTLKSLSTPGGGGFNEIRIEDKKGEEQIFIHAEKDQDIRVKKDIREWIGNDTHLIVKRDKLGLVEGDFHSTVNGDLNEKVGGTISVTAEEDYQGKVGMAYALDSGMEIHLKAGMNVVIEAGMSITLKAGGGFIVVGPAGVTISGTPVLINSGGSVGSGSGSSPESPKMPMEADTAKPGKKEKLGSTGAAKAAPLSPCAQAQVMREAAKTGTPFCEKCAEAARKAGTK